MIPLTPGCLTLQQYHAVLEAVIAAGHADDVEWAERIEPPPTPTAFALELIYVICNSGMKQQVARNIYQRVRAALRVGNSARTVFGHPGKSKAIDHIWNGRNLLFRNYMATPDTGKIAFLGALPWIGAITKFHAAKNFTVIDALKPDRHIARLAGMRESAPPDEIYAAALRLLGPVAEAAGHRIATVDTVLWRAAAIGIIDTRAMRVQQADRCVPNP